MVKNGRAITCHFGVSGLSWTIKFLFCSTRKGEFGRIVDVNRYMRWWTFKTYQRWACFLHFSILSLSAIPISLRAFYSTRCVSMMLTTRIFRRPRFAWLKWVTVEISSWESFYPIRHRFVPFIEHHEISFIRKLVILQLRHIHSCVECLCLNWQTND